MQTLSRQEESQMLDAVDAVDRLTSCGYSPTAAVVKVSRDASFDDGRVRLLAHAINGGQQVHQWGHGKTALQKLAPFELVDADAAVRAAYAAEPAPEKISADYRLSPAQLRARPEPRAPFVRTKAAAAPARDRANLKIRRDELAVDAERQRRSCADKMGRLFDYWQRPKEARCGFSAFAAAVSAYRPGDAGILVDGIAAGLPEREKTARYRDDEPWQEPLRLLDEAVAAGLAHVKAAAALKSADEALTPPAPAALPLEGRSLLPPSPLQRWKLAAEFGNLATGALGSLAANSVEPLAGRDPDQQSVINRLNDPGLDAEIHRIQTEATLSRLMTDPDDPISGYDPDQVLDTYNEISALAPRTGQYAGALGPLLRRRLAGHVEPFEVAQTTQLGRELHRPAPAGAAPGPNREHKPT